MRPSKADLFRELFDPESTSAEVALMLARESRAQLAARLSKQVRAAMRKSRAKCPKGHEPNDPACSIDCLIVTVSPFPSPAFFLPKVPAHHHVHEWALDTLHSPHIDALGETYRGLNAQFDALSGAPTRLPYTFGWWWRIPYGWLLQLNRLLTPRRWR